MPEIVTSSTDMPSSLTDAIGIGTLTRLVPRELVDEVVASEGRTEIRKNKLPARVMVYFVMAMALFYGDAYEEVIRKLADGLDYIATWQPGMFSVPDMAEAFAAKKEKRETNFPDLLPLKRGL